MRYAKIVIGILLLIKGIKAVIDLPTGLAMVHASAAAPGFAAGYAAGETVGIVIGALVVLTGGIMLVISGWTHRSGRVAQGPAARTCL
jgi:hypothetical protein